VAPLTTLSRASDVNNNGGSECRLTVSGAGVAEHTLLSAQWRCLDGIPHRAPA
jgi:hypothetical protein